MKIGLVSFHTFSQPGGVKNHILGLYKEFKKRGIEVKIVVPRRKKNENYGEDVILLGTSFPMKISGSRADFCVNFNHLGVKKMLDEENFDILHFHNFGFPSTLQILMHSGALNVFTLHANVEDSKLLNTFPSIFGILGQIAKWKADGIIAVSPFNLKPFRNYRGPKTVIPNGVDLQEFNAEIPKIQRFNDDKINAFDNLSIDLFEPDPHSRRPERRRRVNILFVGRIEERKGLIYLLKSYKILIKKFPNLRLIIVGDGELKKYCQKWARTNKLKEVFFEGEKTGLGLPPYYAAADIFVSPAIFGESFGIVLLEAMASGKPVVAFANKGYKEFLKDKKGNFLAKTRDFRDLAKKIEILIKDEKLRKQMGERAMLEAKDYSWDIIASEVVDFYKFCEKQKHNKKQMPSAIDEIFSSLYNVDIFNWFKKPK